MALKSTIYKARLNVADTDRNVYQDFNLTVARHPSETDGRMMLRLLAFALNADENLEFGRGISTEDEPDLWQRSLGGNIEHWIDLGTPEPERLRKACGRSGKVSLYCYGRRAVPVWWQKHGETLVGLDKLTVYEIDGDSCDALEAMATANMDLQCTVTDGEAWFSDGANTVNIVPGQLK